MTPKDIIRKSCLGCVDLTEKNEELWLESDDRKLILK